MSTPDVPEAVASPESPAPSAPPPDEGQPSAPEVSTLSEAPAAASPPEPAAASPEAPAEASPPPETPVEGPPLPDPAEAPPPSQGWPYAPVGSGPYRTPPYDAVPFTARAPRPPWATLGPALRVFAVLMWAYVVVGQFTVGWPLGRPLNPWTALALVLLLTLLAWVVALRTSYAVAPASPLRVAGRGLAIAAGAFGFFVVAVVAPILVAAVMPRLRGYDLLVAFGLVATSLGAALLGEHISHSPDLPRPLRSHGNRFVLVLAWVAGALLTLVAGADLAGNL